MSETQDWPRKRAALTRRARALAAEFEDIAQDARALGESGKDAGMSDDNGTTRPRCFYCQGGRSLCTCTKDCGARQGDHGHVCGQAPPGVRAEWLRSTGLYSEEEIADIT